MINVGVSETSRNQCTLCGAWQGRLKYALRKFSVMRCESCEAVFTTLRPDRAELEAMYDEGYFQSRRGYFFENTACTPGTAPDDNIHAYTSLLDRLASRAEPGRLLDVGCGTGVFLSMARARGWDVQGVELSPFAAQQARERLRLDVVTGMLRDGRFPNASFDVITMLDVFEHLPDPRSELRELFRVLRPGGVLLLDTPNARALLRRMADWIYRWSGGAVRYPVAKLYHEFHLYYFSEHVLRRLLGEVGFRVEHVEGRAIPLPKARGNALEKLIVKGLSRLETRLDGPYELIVMASRPRAAERM